jgi:Cu(I)/Ag(I) efflux system membrane fusion protein
LSACSSQNHEKPAAVSPAVEGLTDASHPATPAQRLLQDYLRLQTKLVADDAAGAKRSFADVQSAAKVEALPLPAERRAAIERAAAQGASAANIAAARSAFAGVSDALLAWLSAAENPLSQPLTVVHCPMALDGKGSRWLQLGSQVKNPYFGAEMLTCGDVERTLAPAAAKP